MPAIAVVVLCYAAGALAGLHGLLRIGVAAATLLAGLSLACRDIRLAAASAALCAGMLIGAAATREDRA